MPSEDFKKFFSVTRNAKIEIKYIKRNSAAFKARMNAHGWNLPQGYFCGLKKFKEDVIREDSTLTFYIRCKCTENNVTYGMIRLKMSERGKLTN